MQGVGSSPAVMAIAVVVCAASAQAASMSVQPLALAPGESGWVVVEGTIAAESTFGLTIIVQLIPTADTTGAVVFTPAPPQDIFQAGDPWLGAGTFTPFDTDQIGLSSSVNAAVDDNGTFIAAPVSYSGPLAIFPVQAGSNATGTWTIALSTSVGDSAWEGVPTELTAATITVAGPIPLPAASAWGLVVMTLSLALLATLALRRSAPCVD